VIAKKGEEWERMLKELLNIWVEEVSKEARENQGDGARTEAMADSEETVPAI
jgi:hypothetical protein